MKIPRAASPASVLCATATHRVGNATLIQALLQIQDRYILAAAAIAFLSIAVMSNLPAESEENLLARYRVEVLLCRHPMPVPAASDMCEAAWRSAREINWRWLGPSLGDDPWRKGG